MRRFALITLLYAAVLTAVMLFLPGCAVTREATPPDLRDEWDQLERAEQAAQLTPEPEDDAAVEAAWADLEGRISKRQAEPWAWLLPAGLAPLALELVGALGSKRKRKLYGSALKQVSKGQLASAAGEALKAWGASHSSPQPPPSPPQA